jgi:hypothetical protein
MGAYAVILGLECLVLDRAVLASDGQPTKSKAKVREIVPAEWAPWGLLSAGVVTMLYTITIPQRVSTKKQ